MHLSDKHSKLIKGRYDANSSGIEELQLMCTPFHDSEFAVLESSPEKRKPDTRKAFR